MAETRQYDISYAITVDDAVHATRLFQASLYRRWIGGLLVVLAAAIAFAIWVDAETGVWIGTTAALLIALSFFKPLDRWLIRRRARSLLGGTTELHIDEDGIRYRNPLGSGDLLWSALTEVRGSDETVLFIRDRILSAYAPSSAFASPRERAEVVAFARERIAAARH